MKSRRGRPKEGTPKHIRLLKMHIRNLQYVKDYQERSYVSVCNMVASIKDDIRAIRELVNAGKQ